MSHTLIAIYHCRLCGQEIALDKGEVISIPEVVFERVPSRDVVRVHHPGPFTEIVVECFEVQTHQCDSEPGRVGLMDLRGFHFIEPESEESP